MEIFLRKKHAIILLLFILSISWNSYAGSQVYVFPAATGTGYVTFPGVGSDCVDLSAIVPVGATNVVVTLTNLGVDFDLFARNNGNCPTTGNYSYVSGASGTTNESVNLGSFCDGNNWRVRVNKYSSGSGGATLTISWTDPAPVPGFGSNSWNVLAYNAPTTYNAVNYLNLTGTTYRGYYTNPNLNISTNSLWGLTASPSAASGYVGCPVTNNNHVFIYKRKGFASGCYSISNIVYDDAIRIYIDGSQVYENTGCCSMAGVAWLGYLDANSEVEIRVAENTGDSRLNLDFATGATFSVTANYDPTACGPNIVLNSSYSVAPGASPYQSLTYNWTGASIVSGANTATPTVNPTSSTTYTLNASYNGCASAPVNVTVNPLIITASSTIVCPNGTLDLSTPGEWASLPTNATLVTGANPNNEYYSRFTANTSFNTPVELKTARLLVVGGGGGGGSNGGGGGGAGGFYTNSSISIPSGNTTVTIGAGGAVHNNSASPNTAATNGGQSAFGSYTAGGGGGGASRDQGLAGQNGGTGTVQGSGGGGGGCVTSATRHTGGTGVFSGGTGFRADCPAAGGGGGGAGSAGSNAASNNGGAGGAGLQSNITGVNLWYAGGGGGGTTNFNGGACGNGNVYNNGAGGSSVGGYGETNSGSTNIIQYGPTANTGSGGGAEQTGAAGVVIIRYRVPKYTLSAITATGTTINELTGVITAGSTAGTVTVTYTNEFGCTTAPVIITVGGSIAPLETTVSPVGNCSGATVTLKVNDKVGKGGLIDHSTWTVGTGSITGYTVNETNATENARINGTDPWGKSTVIWEGRASGDGNGDGGWNGSQVAIDNTKTYRYSVWIKRTVQGTAGRFYLGLQSNAGGAYTLAGSSDGNPYFWYSSTPAGSELPTGEWVLVVGYVHPVSYTGATDPTSGRYTVSGGRYGGIFYDYKWAPGTTTASLRTYLYYADGTAQQQWVYPRIDVVDGSEPSIQDLLAGFDKNDGLGDGASWNWYSGSCGGTSAGTGSSITVAPASTTRYFVRAEGGTCAITTTCKEATVIINPKVSDPTITANGATTFCNGGSVQLTASDISHAGNAMSFTGGQAVSLGNPPSLKITGNQTIEMWVKPTNYASGRQNPYNKAYAGEGTITQETNGYLNYYYGIDGNNGLNYQGFTSGGAVNNGQWNHIAIVRDFTNNQLRWYINGVLSSTGTPAYSYAVAGGNDVTIGTGYAGGYDGLIDEVRVWNVARTTSQIQADMNAPIAPGTSGLVGYWKFDEASGGIVTDASGYSNSGTSTGTRAIPSTAPMEAPAGTYTWSPATGLSTTSGKVVTASPGSSQTYTVEVANPLGCAVGSKVQAVTVIANPTGGALSATDYCAGGSSTASVSGVSNVTQYSWSLGGLSGSSTTSSIGVSGGTGGTSYTISVTPQNVVSGTTCPGTAVTASIKVDAPSTLPSLITVDNNTNNCWGRPVTLTENGGILQGASQYIYGTSVGGTQVSGATNATSVTTVPSGTATYYVGVTANGACPAQNLATGITYALPTRNALLSSNSSGTCYVSGSNPIHFYDASNNYIGSLNPQGRTGIVTMSTSVGSPAIQGACTMPSNPKYRTAYLGRIVHVDGSGLSGSGNVDVVLAYSDAELLALQVQAGNGSGGSTPGNVTDDITNLLNPSLGITKVGGDGSLCSGNSVSYLSAGGGVLSVTPSISAARYVSFAVPSFSSFYIHGVNGGSPLPITLTSFTASCEDKVSLMWKTATETNVSHYEILRSRDGQFWEEVATIPAVGNSTTEQVYHATDATGLETMYYKLRSVDNDGTSEDFQPVSVTCNPGALWSIHPVPVSVKATVTVTATETSHDVFVITDINGRVVTTQQVEIKAGTSIFELDLHRLSEGTYFIRMNQSDKYSPLKFIKVD